MKEVALKKEKVIFFSFLRNLPAFPVNLMEHYCLGQYFQEQKKR